MGLAIHWIACFWYRVASLEKSWTPAKDLDWHYTEAFGGDKVAETILLEYYAMLTLQANDLLPTSEIEIFISILLVFIGTIAIGILIGEVSSVLQEMTKKGRQENDDYEELE